MLKKNVKKQCNNLTSNIALNIDVILNAVKDLCKAILRCFDFAQHDKIHLKQHLYYYHNLL